MRISTVCGVLLLLAGCNQLPQEEVGGDDLGLRTGDGVDGGSAGAGEVYSETAPVDYDRSACEAKAKECYASGDDVAPCAAILKGCAPPPPAPTPAPCGEDCDANVRSCFAKGIDAPTCDALYHACLSPEPGNVTRSTDPVADCLMAAKSCYAKDGDPAVCDALMAGCVPNAGEEKAPK